MKWLLPSLKMRTKVANRTSLDSFIDMVARGDDIPRDMLEFIASGISRSKNTATWTSKPQVDTSKHYQRWYLYYYKFQDYPATAGKRDKAVAEYLNTSDKSVMKSVTTVNNELRTRKHIGLRIWTKQNLSAEDLKVFHDSLPPQTVLDGVRSSEDV